METRGASSCRRTGPLEGVQPEQQFDEVVVRWKPCSLHNEDVATTDVLQDPHEEVAFEEAQHLGPAQLAAEICGDSPTQLGVAGADNTR